MRWKRSPRLPPLITIAHVSFLCTIIISAIEYQCFALSSGVFLSSLIGEMEGKEREREEN